MIAVLDYGVGNLGSIMNMFRKIGAEARLVSSPDEVSQSTKILLPGVGAFDNGMRRLNESGMRDALYSRVVDDHVPLLGICLGMQMLGKGSDEGVEPGLGLIDAWSKRFQFGQDSPLKVPHMGWSLIQPRRDSDLLVGLDTGSRFYFVHSFHVVVGRDDLELARSDYGVPFTSAVQQGNIMGTQFHPEKSHQFGMTLLRNFASL